MLLKELDAPKIVAKAENNIQGKMLHKNRCDQVIYPEYDMVLRLVQSLTRDHVMDYLQLSKILALLKSKCRHLWLAVV